MVLVFHVNRVIILGLAPENSATKLGEVKLDALLSPVLPLSYSTASISAAHLEAIIPCGTNQPTNQPRQAGWYKTHQYRATTTTVPRNTGRVSVQPKEPKARKKYRQARQTTVKSVDFHKGLIFADFTNINIELTTHKNTLYMCMSMEKTSKTRIHNSQVNRFKIG